MSFPLNRIKLIKQDSPRQASHAPIVKRIRIREVSEGLSLEIDKVQDIIMERIMASRARSAIRRCLR